ncbi:UNVERIFIED_CONTAM: hypothetical protein Sangu_2907300 [Sesamum angustifolium]|uniref:Uncharacterized protein n=1 Tax=Sesamum angustifolium TaxID=2727405 RepID=A0AAW2IMW5_9LAMI
MYYAAANGLAEAFNKTLCNLLKNVVAKSKRDWHEMMEKLYGYRTTVRHLFSNSLRSSRWSRAVLPLE